MNKVSEIFMKSKRNIEICNAPSNSDSPLSFYQGQMEGISCGTKVQYLIGQNFVAQNFLRTKMGNFDPLMEVKMDSFSIFD